MGVRLTVSQSWRFEETSGDRLVLSSSRFSWSRVAEGHIHLKLEYFQGGILHNIPEKPVPVLTTVTVNKFLMFKWHFLYTFVPLVLAVGIAERSMILSSLHSPVRFLYAWVGSR